MNTKENDDIRQTLKQAMPDNLPPAVAEQMQSRLAAFRDRVDAKSKRPRNRISQRIGEFTMRQRIAVFGGVGAAAVLGFFLLWGLAAKPASAMERMAEAVRKATSYKCTETIKTTFDFPKPGRPTVAVAVYTIYRQLPGAARSDETSSYHSWKGTEKTEIFPVDQPSIYIWHPTKTFRRYPPLRKGPYSSTFDRLEDLGQFSSQADRQLGTKEINGKQADGFEIDMKKMHPDARGSIAEIWLDRATNLPLFVR
jgi:outer membrane lipoprotein-sorting protein